MIAIAFQRFHCLGVGMGGSFDSHVVNHIADNECDD